MKTKENTRTHIRVPELAKKLGVSQGAIRLWASKRIIPCTKIKHVIIFDEAEVMKALDRYKTTELKPEGIK